MRDVGILGFGMIKCGICVEFCPKKVLELDNEDKVKVARPQDCICCRLCELRCPDLAIEIELEE